MGLFCLGVTSRPSVTTRQLVVGNNGEEQRIVKRRRWAKLAIGTVAAGAVRCVQGAEILDLVGWHRTVGGIRLAGKVAARCQDRQKEQQRQRFAEQRHVVCQEGRVNRRR